MTDPIQFSIQYYIFFNCTIKWILLALLPIQYLLLYMYDKDEYTMHDNDTLVNGTLLSLSFLHFSRSVFLEQCIWLCVTPFVVKSINADTKSQSVH